MATPTFVYAYFSYCSLDVFLYYINRTDVYKGLVPEKPQSYEGLNVLLKDTSIDFLFTPRQGRQMYKNDRSNFNYF